MCVLVEGVPDGLQASSAYPQPLLDKCAATSVLLACLFAKLPASSNWHTHLDHSVVFIAREHTSAAMTAMTRFMLTRQGTRSCALLARSCHP